MAINANSHIIAVSGGKGGVGKSIFAANFAQALSLELRGKVLLIDLDSQSCGDQNIILGIRPLKIISEVVNYGGQFSSSTISTIATPHPSGISYIGAVRNPGDTFDVNTDGLKKSLEGLSNLFNFIVVDIGSQLQNPQLTVLENASCMLAVTLPEMLAVNQTQRMINQLMTMMFPTDMMQVVLNMVSQNSPLSPQLVTQTMRRNVAALIPQDDVIVSTALARSTPFVASQPRAAISIAFHELVRRLTQGGALDKMRQLNKPKGTKGENQVTQIKALGANSITQARPGETTKIDSFDLRNNLKQRLHRGLLDTSDLNKYISEIKGDPAKENELRIRTQQTIASLLEKENQNFTREERALIVKEVLDEALGLGPLEDLLADPSISEIMVNRRDLIFIEKSGRLIKSDRSFTSNKELRTIIERIVTPLGRRINDTSPYVDARLKDGSRVNAIIPPLALDGPCLTIRKFAKVPITFKDYIGYGTMTEAMIDFLRICIENKLNIIISGGTGSGKTTLLNVLSGFIPATERIITVEDAAELQLKQEHVVRLETKPASLEGAGAVTIRDLVRNTLRMRPDRIVVGECRGGEALDMLSAMNTGHDGSLTTVHSNSPREAVSRLETLCLMAGMDLPAKAIREQIAGAIDLIIQISRLSDGSRKVVSVTEVVGIQGEAVTLNEIYKFEEKGMDKNRKVLGQFVATGFIPTFLQEFKKRNINIPNTLFTAPAAGPGTPTPNSAPNPKTGTGGGNK